MKISKSREQKKNLGGIVAMLPTPMYPDCKVNYAALTQLTHWAASHDVNGIVVTPSIGEFSRLTDEERWECWRVCKNVVDRDYPDTYMIAMISADDTLQVCEHARVAKTMGYDAGQLIPTYYWTTEEDEIFDHYQMAADVGLPIVVYHNPALSKIFMSRKFLGKLAEIPGVVAIKEVKTDPHVDLEPLFDVVTNRVPIFTTYRVAAFGLMLGSAGVFANAQTVPFCKKILELFQQRNFNVVMRMIEIQREVNRVFPRGGEANKRHIGMNKMAATLVTGIDVGPPRPPNKIPDARDEEKMRKALPWLWSMIYSD